MLNALFYPLKTRWCVTALTPRLTLGKSNPIGENVAQFVDEQAQCIAELHGWWLDLVPASERVSFGLNWSRCNNPRNRIIDPLGGCNEIHLCSCLGERLFNLWVRGWVFAVQSTHKSLSAQLRVLPLTLLSVIKRVSPGWFAAPNRSGIGAEDGPWSLQAVLVHFITNVGHH